MSQTKVVDYRFKLLYAIGTLMVIGGHLKDDGGLSLLQDWFPFYGLHLPLFVFCFGYFYREESEEAIPAFTAKKFRKLIIPLYLYNFAYGLFILFLQQFGFRQGTQVNLYNLLIAPIVNGHQFTYNMGGWFIIPLFMIQIFTVVCRKLLRILHKRTISEHFFLILNLTLGILGNLLAIAGYIDGWSLVLVRMLHLIPFFELGIYYRKVLEPLCRKIPGSVYFTAIFVAKLLILLIYKRMPEYTASWCWDFYDGPVMPILVGVLGIAFWLRIADMLAPVIGKSKCVNLIADHSFSIMINQFLGYMLLNAFYGAVSCLVYMGSPFDWDSFQKNVWYVFMPYELPQTLILYTISGIVVPVVLQKIIDKAVHHGRKLIKKGVHA